MIYVGKIVNQKPTYEGNFFDPPMQGVVRYVHPKGIYYVAEFEFGRGRSFREAFYLPRSRVAEKLPREGHHHF